MSEKAGVTSSQGADVAALTYGQAYTAAKTWHAAMEKDPIFVYMREVPGYKPRGPLMMHLRILATMVLLWLRMQRKLVLTINGGQSLIIAEPVNLGKKKILDYLFDWAVMFFLWCMNKLRPREGQKRWAEVYGKLDEATTRYIGDADRRKGMVHVAALGTHPAAQGKRYGGALLDYVTAMADKNGQTTHLESSNPLNVPFYRRHGFVVVGEVSAGDDNPCWTRSPVRGTILVRKPKET
ncbi:hypothetical protein HGRIS_013638 [Hohenbuehelia grisea]|uniref:N-acetyltransferase domain-containing protein n=1 Tax=Hohenbuehelia grisea TaxID=104357 RepID=A0ABR3IW69_9AGAR